MALARMGAAGGEGVMERDGASARVCDTECDRAFIY